MNTHDTCIVKAQNADSLPHRRLQLFTHQQHRQSPKERLIYILLQRLYLKINQLPRNTHGT